MRKTALALVALCVLLPACSTTPSRPASTQPSRPTGYTPPTRPPIPSQPVPQAQVMRLPGLEDVIGSDADDLLRQFGNPRIDLREDDVRKLQFSAEPCVLDIYLYPPEGGGEPRATHVDARRASDGQDVDRAQCIAALRAALGRR